MLPHSAQQSTKSKIQNRHDLIYRTYLNLNEKTYNSDFSLKDEKACRNCKYFCNDTDSLKFQLSIKSTTPVYVINMEDVAGCIQEDTGTVCDYLLADDSKIVLLEMTCTNTNYIESKRQKARKQLYNSLCLLHTNPIIRNHIESKQYRYVLLSWKNTLPEPAGNDHVAKNMKSMSLMNNATYSQDNISKFDFDFLLKEIRNPNVLVWNTL